MDFLVRFFVQMKMPFAMHLDAHLNRVFAKHVHNRGRYKNHCICVSEKYCNR